MTQYSFKEIKEPLRRIISAINKREELQRIICKYPRGNKPSIWDLEKAICRDLLKERDLFGEIISEQEEAQIRDYIQQLNGDRGRRGPYGHILDIRENFLGMLADTESEEWLRDYVNPARIKEGFEPISSN